MQLSSIGTILQAPTHDLRQEAGITYSLADSSNAIVSADPFVTQHAETAVQSQ